MADGRTGLDLLLEKLNLKNRKSGILNSYNTQFRNNNLVSLDLIKCGISYLENGIFDNFIHLEKLFLSHNHLDEIPHDLFFNLHELNHIDLRGNGLQNIHKDQFKNQFKLKRLELNDNSLSEIPMGIFRSLYALEELNLSNNNISQLHPDIFDNLVHLHRLYLYFNPLPHDLANGDYYDRESVKELIAQIKLYF